MNTGGKILLGFLGAVAIGVGVQYEMKESLIKKIMAKYSSTPNFELYPAALRKMTISQLKKIYTGELH
jgi:hypothetical protein